MGAFHLIDATGPTRTLPHPRGSKGNRVIRPLDLDNPQANALPELTFHSRELRLKPSAFVVSSSYALSAASCEGGRRNHGGVLEQ